MLVLTFPTKLSWNVGHYHGRYRCWMELTDVTIRDIMINIDGDVGSIYKCVYVCTAVFIIYVCIYILYAQMSDKS